MGTSMFLCLSDRTVRTIITKTFCGQAADVLVQLKNDYPLHEFSEAEKFYDTLKRFVTSFYLNVFHTKLELRTSIL
jgi:hypothetical protein